MTQMHLFPEDNSEVARLVQERAKLKQSRFAEATVRGYGYDWSMFKSWCEDHKRSALPATPETVSLYLTYLLTSGKKVATARRRDCAIAHYHRAANYPSPITCDVLDLLSGAQRQRQERPRQMRPLTVEHLRVMSTQLAADGCKKAIRDRALLLVGFASALRRSSLAELDLADIEFTREGMIVHVRREKQDQEGRGRLIGIPRGKHRDTCPVRCLEDWLAQRGRAPGPLFTRLDWGRHGRMDGECVARVVKRSIASIGLDPADRFGAHSLRAGFVTAAGEAGANELLIASQTGHRSMTVLRGYFRRTELFKANACALVGL